MATLSYFADIDPVLPQDCILHAAPLSHGSGLYGLPHVARRAVSVVPESGGVDGDEIAALLRRWPAMSLFAAPAMVKRLAGDRAVAAADLSHLKTIICGGAPMYLADLEKALAVFGPRLAQIYGQGETPSSTPSRPTTTARWSSGSCAIGFGPGRRTAGRVERRSPARRRPNMTNQSNAHVQDPMVDAGSACPGFCQLSMTS
jgi:acyl-CoA synthetase (AMP-forming)/AMP-acid ligase II